nr:MAG TPA: hypothetical protein [Caudoviricetes sp.]
MLVNYSGVKDDANIFLQNCHLIVPDDTCCQFNVSLMYR